MPSISVVWGGISVKSESEILMFKIGSNAGVSPPVHVESAVSCHGIDVHFGGWKVCVVVSDWVNL